MFSYNPGVQNQSGQFIAQGIQQGMAKVGQGLREHRQKEEAKQADAEAVSFAVQKGWVKDDAEGKAAVKALGGGKAAVTLLGQMNQMEEQQKIAQQQQELRAGIAAQEKAAQEQKAAAWRKEQNAILASQHALAGKQAEVYARAGGADPQYMNALRGLGEDAQGEKPSIQFVEDPVTGARFAMSNKGVVSGSGTNPAKAGESKYDPKSTTGKMLADADAYEAEGNLDYATLLRDLAKRPTELRPSQNDMQRLESAEFSLMSKLNQLDEIDAEIEEKGTGSLWWNRGKDREKLREEAKAAEARLENLRKLITDPLGNKATGGTSGTTTKDTAAPAETKLYKVDGDQVFISPKLPPTDYLKAMQQAVDDGVIDADTAREALKAAGFTTKG